MHILTLDDALDLALHDLEIFESDELALYWHEFFCIWFAGEVSVVSILS